MLLFRYDLSQHPSQGRAARALEPVGGSGEACAAALLEAGQGQPRRQKVKWEELDENF